MKYRLPIQPEAESNLSEAYRKTPNEVYFRRKPANCKPRYEPRPQWPRGSPCADPQAPIKVKRGGWLTLHVNFVHGRSHWPMVKLRRARHEALAQHSYNGFVVIPYAPAKSKRL